MKKTILITGANSGIGLSLVKTYLAKDYIVYAHYNRLNNNLLKLKNNLLYLVQGDFSDTKEIKKVFYSCVKKGMDIDILINNAGTFSQAKNIEEIIEQDFDRVFQVNLKAPFLLSQMALGVMKEKQWGRIINISSIGVKFGGGVGSVPYTVSKSGLETMTLAFSKAGAPYNVLVNAIRVGVTDTKFHDLNPNKNLENRAGLIPLKRMATTKEIADTIYFLTTDKSSYTTGSIITIAGGE